MFFWYLANLHDQNRDEMSATFSHRRRLYHLDIKLSSLILIIVNFLHDTRRGGKWGGCWIYVSLDWVKYLIIFPAGALFCDSILWQHFMTVWNLSDSIWDIFRTWRLLHVSVENIICLYIICLYSHRFVTTKAQGLTICQHVHSSVPQQRWTSHIENYCLNMSQYIYANVEARVDQCITFREQSDDPATKIKTFLQLFTFYSGWLS